jgi:aminoglycoside phosphotransferase (APT) family kinase protein
MTSHAVSDAAAAVAGVSACDWRYLMRAPDSGRFSHVSLPGSSEADRAAARDAGVAKHVSAELPAEASADAVVVRSPVRVAMKDVARALTRTGTAYVEVDRSIFASRRRTPRAVARACEQSGLAHVCVYALIGNFRSPRALIPIGGLAPFRWYLDTLVRSATPAGMALEGALRMLLPRGPEAVAAFCPRFVVVASRAEPDLAAAPMLALELASGIETYRSSEVLFLLAGGDRVVALPFSGQREVPDAVIKIPRAPALVQRTTDDHAALRSVRARLSRTLLDSVPVPLGAKSVAGAHAATESVVNGASILRTSGRWRAPTARRLDDLHRSAVWLADMHRATEARRARWNDHGAELLRDLTERYRAAFGRRDDEEALFGHAARYSDQMGAAELPIVLRHGDFNPWNVVRDGDRIGVVDWEGAREGPALIDLLQFCTNWYDAVRGALREEAKWAHYPALFVGRSADGLIVGARRIIDAYLSRVGMKRSLMPPLLLASWLDLALSRERQRRDHGGEAGDPRVANRAIPFIGILAAQRERLFGPDAWQDKA